jgi:hypothetical protein
MEKIISLSAVLFLLFVSNCKDNVDPLVEQISQIDFELVAMDEEQIESVRFEFGTDVNLALKIINNSGREFKWSDAYSCQILQLEDFMVVSKEIKTEDGNISHAPVGRPYIEPVNCQAINLPARNISTGKSILIRIPWSNNPKNEKLVPGKYFTECTLKEINGYETVWILRAYFEIN